MLVGVPVFIFGILSILLRLHSLCLEFLFSSSYCHLSDTMSSSLPQFCEQNGSVYGLKDMPKVICLSEIIVSAHSRNKCILHLHALATLGDYCELKKEGIFLCIILTYFSNANSNA